MLPTVDPRVFAPLALRANVLADGVLSGLHASPTRGAASEFAEYKEYSPGDDVRRIDWRASARQDRTYVREREHEAQIDVSLVLDVSASMSFGSGTFTKAQHGATLLATLANLAARQHDRIGLGLLGGSQPVLPHRDTRSHASALIAQLEAAATQTSARDNATAPLQLDKLLAQWPRRRGLLVLASDFFDASFSLLRALRRARARDNDVIAFLVLDPAERDFPYDGMTRFEALESHDSLLVDAAVVRQTYLARLAEFVAATSRSLQQVGIPLIRADVDQDIRATIAEMLVHRAKRQRGGP